MPDRLTWVPCGFAGYKPGMLTRWREVTRGRWCYGYYRGFNDAGHLTFSREPGGPITMWRVGAPLWWEIASLTSDHRRIETEQETQ